MLERAEAVAFLPSVDLERAEAFFHGVLGLPVLSRSPYATVFVTDTGTMRVTRVDDLRPQPFTVLGWLVDDVHAVLRSLVERGTDPLRYDGMAQDDDGVWTTPTGDLIAWFPDPDGNVLSLTQLAAG